MKASIAIADEVRSRIARGDLLPGDPLPVEEELSEQWGCSRPVAREALRILETEGLVEIRRGVGGGAVVRWPSPVDAARTVGLHLQLGDVRVLDVWEARDRIIASAVERLAASAAPGGVARLEAAVAELADRLGDLERFNEQMFVVGEEAVRAAGNATELLLVQALRHVVAREIGAATRRVRDEADLRLARRQGEAIVASWRRSLGHVRAGRAPSARHAVEQQAAALRDLVGIWNEEQTVGDAAKRFG